MDRLDRVGRYIDGGGLFNQFDPGTPKYVILCAGRAEVVERDLGVAEGNQVVASVVYHPYWYCRHPDGIRLSGQPV